MDTDRIPANLRERAVAEFRRNGHSAADFDAFVGLIAETEDAASVVRSFIAVDRYRSSLAKIAALCETLAKLDTVDDDAWERLLDRLLFSEETAHDKFVGGESGPELKLGGDGAAVYHDQPEGQPPTSRRRSGREVPLQKRLSRSGSGDALRQRSNSAA